MPHAYNEYHLVEKPAIRLFAELGWATVVAMEEVLGPLLKLTSSREAG